MSTENVKNVLDMAIIRTGADQVNALHRPRLLTCDDPGKSPGRLSTMAAGEKTNKNLWNKKNEHLAGWQIN